jgi:hypothetical protein
MGWHRGLSAAAVVLLGVLAAACSSSPSTPSATTTTTSSSSTSIVPTPASTPSTVATSTTTATTAGTTRCATTTLIASVVGGSGAAGTIETTLGLKSTGSAPCVLGGYPGLQLLSSSGASLPTKVIRGGHYTFTSMAPTTVTLTTGQSVYFNIGYSDVPVDNETSCPTSSSLEVTPPNSYPHLIVKASLAPCGGGTLVVSPVFASGTNTQTTAP